MRQMMLITCAIWLVASSGLLRADDQTPDAILKTKGLTKVGSFYLLDQDAQLQQSLRPMRQAQAQMEQSDRKRSQIEDDIQMADSSIAQWDQQYRQLNDQIQNTQDPNEHNRLVGPINALVSKIQQATIFKQQRQKDLGKLGDPRDDYIAIVMDLSDKMEATQKQYDTLAADDQVKDELSQVNQTSKIKMKLGPSPRFVQELANIRRAKMTISSAVIKLTVEGGVPQVNVKLNNSITQQMVVDSGASFVTLTSESAAQLGVTPGDGDPVIRLTVANGKTVDAHLIHLKSIRLAQFTVENVDCAVLPASVSGAVDLLGDTFLRHFTYRMDMNAGELHMSEIAGKNTPGDVKVDSADSPTTQTSP
jgi:clan AA aspartic protease (TIGR02281 family)